MASFETLVASTAWKDCPSEDLVNQIVGEMETRLPAAELRIPSNLSMQQHSMLAIRWPRIEVKLHEVVEGMGESGNFHMVFLR